MRLPSNNKVTFPYGETSYPYSASNPHAGTDYAKYPNVYVYLPEACNIIATGEMGDCGIAVNATSLDGRRKYRFCHLFSYMVRGGEQCTEGTKVGIIGATGYAIGAHLHFIMWLDGKRIDGDKYIRSKTMATSRTQVKKIFNKLLFRNPDEGAYTTYTPLEEVFVWNDVANSAERTRREAEISAKDETIATLRAEIGNMEKTLSDLSTRPTKAEYEKVVQKVEETLNELTTAQTALDEAEADLVEARANQGSEVESWLTNLINWFKNLWRN